VNFSGRKVNKRVKESKYVATLLVVVKSLLLHLDHLAKQDSLMAQYSLNHVELNFKLEKFNILNITFTNAQYSISIVKRLFPYMLGYGVSCL
jgi:hypothetical protein